MLKYYSSLPLRLFVFTGLVAILGSLLYYTLPVTRLGLATVVALAFVVTWVVPFAPASPVSPQSLRSFPKSAYALAVVVLLALGAWWSAIGNVAIVDAVRSPWGVVPPFAVVTFGLAFFALLVLAARAPSRTTAVLFAVTLFSAIALATIVYPLGFGFDPFLHRATMEHIAQFGTITPKPLYYIGEYALELAPHMLLGVPIALVDRFLLPLLAAIMLTASVLIGLAPLGKTRSMFALSALLLLPLGMFISTTPQGLAYLLSASAIVLTFARLSDPKFSLVPSFVLSLAALFTHPFAGIPAVIYVAAFFALTKIDAPAKRLAVLVGTTVVSAVAIPLVFALQAAHSGLSLAFNLANLFDAARWQTLQLGGFFSNHFSFGYDALYLALSNLLIFILIAAVVGISTLSTNTDELKTHLAWLPCLVAGAMMLNFLTLSILFDFDFLIAYERTDYALRSLTMAQIFLLPLAGVGLLRLHEALEKKPLVLRACCLALLAVIGMGNVYGAYPRHDNYARSAGFNVSQADIDAVNAIEREAAGADYIALTNQATAAAAVGLNGFKKYYHGDIFYYPIPTGGVLYNYFLTMVDEAPTRETMIAALDVAGTDLGFFAVSDYWWQSEEIIENAKRVADDWFAVDDGAVTVFIFRR